MVGYLFNHIFYSAKANHSLDVCVYKQAIRTMRTNDMIHTVWNSRNASTKAFAYIRFAYSCPKNVHASSPNIVHSFRFSYMLMLLSISKNSQKLFIVLVFVVFFFFFSLDSGLNLKNGWNVINGQSFRWQTMLLREGILLYKDSEPIWIIEHDILVTLLLLLFDFGYGDRFKVIFFSTFKFIAGITGQFV